MLNKCDKQMHFDKNLLSDNFKNVIEISAISGKGRDEICSAVESLFIDGKLDTSSDALISNARQYAAIENAISSVENALESIKFGMPLDACCIDIENAMGFIGEIDGKSVSEDVVAKIFSKFCVGK